MRPKEKGKKKGKEVDGAESGSIMKSSHFCRRMVEQRCPSISLLLMKFGTCLILFDPRRDPAPVEPADRQTSNLHSYLKYQGIQFHPRNTLPYYCLTDFFYIVSYLSDLHSPW